MSSENRESVEQWEIIEFESNTEKVEELELIVKERMSAPGIEWPEADIDNFEYALREAFNNAVIHGNARIELKPGETKDAYDERIIHANQTMGSEKKVEVRLKITREQAKAEVIDEGKFVPPHIPDADSEAGQQMTSRRGLFLINDLMKKNLEFSPGRIVFWIDRAKEV